MGTEWLYGDCGTVCTAATIRSYDGRGTRVWWPSHDKLYRRENEEERRKEKTFIPERKKTEADFTRASGRKEYGMWAHGFTTDTDFIGTSRPKGYGNRR